MKDFTNKLKAYLRASIPCLVINTYEETRALQEVSGVCNSLNKDLCFWKSTTGLITQTDVVVEGTEDLVTAFNEIHKNTIYVLLDVHTLPIEQDPILQRALKDAILDAPLKGASIILLGAEFHAPSSLDKMYTTLDYRLPTENELNEILDITMNDLIQSGASIKKFNKEDVIKALSGMTYMEAANAISLSYMETVKSKKGSIEEKIIYREKITALKRSGLLEYINTDELSIESIGGLELLKDYVQQRKLAFGKEALDYGLDYPKALGLVGVPGTGKSLSAKVIGTILKVPTLRFDIGKMFNSLVGESEKQMRETLALAEALSPCVLWVDEIEKGLAGAGGGSGDSGVTQRVFGTLIHWMQENKEPVYLVATANNVHQLPSELIRRFDEIFAVDLPTEKEREAIFRIHLNKRKRLVENFDIEVMVKNSKDFTGAEIEKAVKSAMYMGFSNNREFTTEDILNTLRDTHPIAHTMKEQITAIKEMIGKRFRRASKEDTVKNTSALKSGGRTYN